MRVLEARFHPDPRNDPTFVVVGHLVWRRLSAQKRPIVRLTRPPRLSATPSTILSKLQYLIRATAPESFERLQALRSRFWSFVDVTRELRERGH